MSGKEIPQAKCQKVSYKLLRYHLECRLEVFFVCVSGTFPFCSLVPGEKIISVCSATTLQYLTFTSALPSRSQSVISSPSLFSSLLFTLHFHSSHCLFLSCDLSYCLSVPFLFVFVYVSVSPVLTPPESEKADSEDRVSLKVCSQHSSSSSLFLLEQAFCESVFLFISFLCFYTWTNLTF